ncbi:hypothetical protein D3C73_1226130 [compost metagenome]
MRPRQVGLEVDAGDNVVEVEDGPGAVTPGSRGDKTVGITAKAVLAVNGIAAIAQLAFVLQPTDVHHCRFTHQGQPVGTGHLIDEVRQAALDLGHFLAAIPFVVGAGPRGDR